MFFLEAISYTLENIKQVIKIEKVISLFWHQILDLFKIIFLYKTFKVTRFIIVDRFILNYIIIEFLIVNT